MCVHQTPQRSNMLTFWRNAFAILAKNKYGEPPGPATSDWRPLGTSTGRKTRVRRRRALLRMGQALREIASVCRDRTHRQISPRRACRVRKARLLTSTT